MKLRKLWCHLLPACSLIILRPPFALQNWQSCKAHLLLCDLI